MYIFEVKGKLA